MPGILIRPHRYENEKRKTSNTPYTLEASHVPFLATGCPSPPRVALPLPSSSPSRSSASEAPPWLMRQVPPCACRDCTGLSGTAQIRHWDLRGDSDSTTLGHYARWDTSWQQEVTDKGQSRWKQGGRTWPPGSPGRPVPQMANGTAPQAAGHGPTGAASVLWGWWPMFWKDTVIMNSSSYEIQTQVNSELKHTVPWRIRQLEPPKNSMGTGAEVRRMAPNSTQCRFQMHV